MFKHKRRFWKWIRGPIRRAGFEQPQVKSSQVKSSQQILIMLKWQPQVKSSQVKTTDSHNVEVTGENEIEEDDDNEDGAECE